MLRVHTKTDGTLSSTIIIQLPIFVDLSCGADILESAPVIYAKLVLIEDAFNFETVDGIVDLVITNLLTAIANTLVQLSSVNGFIEAYIILLVTKALSAAQIKNQSLVLVEIKQIYF